MLGFERYAVNLAVKINEGSRTCPHMNFLGQNYLVMVAIAVSVPVILVPVIVAVPVAVATPLMPIRVIPAVGLRVATVPLGVQS